MVFVDRRNNFVDYEFNVQGPTIATARESGGTEIISGLPMEKS